MTSSGVKHLHARRTGSVDTSDVLTEVQGTFSNTVHGRGTASLIPLDASNQADLWFDNTNVLSSKQMVVHGYYEEGTRG